MPPPLFVNYVISFVLGCGFTLLCIKTGPSLKHKKVVKQLKADNTSLEIDKINLQSRNTDLAKLIGQNQQDIKDLKEDSKGLKEDNKVLSDQVAYCLECLSGITRIRERVADIDDQIEMTKRFRQKYEPFLNDSSQKFKQ